MRMGFELAIPGSQVRIVDWMFLWGGPLAVVVLFSSLTSC